MAELINTTTVPLEFSKDNDPWKQTAVFEVLLSNSAPYPTAKITVEINKADLLDDDRTYTITLSDNQ
jgi:hypothetical protein